ncbi:hypothetical protein KEM55_001265 [Ascosphaera atra]|nr:hypothetical protein KEM55_001265 [Ascosphaera atra]
MSRPATRQITPRTEDSDKKGSRYRVSDLASRTQQRLWLERDAVTPSAHRPAASQSGLEINFQTGGYTPVHMSNRSFGPGSSANVQAGSMNPVKRDKKLYEKYTTEFSVVHRFKDPVADSFRRLQMLPKSDRDAGASKDLGGIPRDYIGAHLSASTAQLSLQSHASVTPSRRPSRSASSARFGSQVRFKTQDDSNLSWVELKTKPWLVQNADIEVTLLRNRLVDK